MTATKIEWADRVWNPSTGCTKVSQGCKHCYAEVVADRFFAKLYPPVYVGPGCDEPADEWRSRRFTDVQCHPDRLDAPLRWRKPSRIFVNSMSDLFHEDVPDEFIDRVFAVMALAPQHTFLVLTKRPDRMRAYIMSAVDPARVEPVMRQLAYDVDGRPEGGLLQLADVIVEGWQHRGGWWPLPNVWLGVSVEDQATADQRIPILLQTPAAVRWVSYEPALAGVDFTDIVIGRGSGSEHHINALSMEDDDVADDEEYSGACLDWIVVGGESGPKARDCDVTWIRSTVEQCQAAGTPVFVKQLGALCVVHCGQCRRTIGKVLGGWTDACGPTHAALIAWSQSILDRKGSDPEEWPDDLRVRQFPGAR